MNLRGKTLRLAVVAVMLASLQSGLQSLYAQEKTDEPVVLPEGTPLKVLTVQEVSSKTANPGDSVEFKVDEDLAINGRVVISRGTPAKGSVINAEKSGHMGKSGRLGIQVESTTTIDGQFVKLRAAKGNEGADKTNSTFALSMIVSPLFMLKKGSEAKIAAGTPVTVYVAQERRFRVEGETLVADNSTAPTDNTAANADSPAIVFIYRPSKMVGGALEPSVFVDGIEVARMDNGRYFALKLTPGKHMVHMTSKSTGFAIDMGPGQTYYFRVGIQAGMWKGEGKLTLQDAEKGIAEIKKLKFLGKDKIKDQTLVVELRPDEAPKP